MYLIFLYEQKTFQIRISSTFYHIKIPDQITSYYKNSSKLGHFHLSLFQQRIERGQDSKKKNVPTAFLWKNVRSKQLQTPTLCMYFRLFVTVLLLILSVVFTYDKKYLLYYGRLQFFIKCHLSGVFGDSRESTCHLLLLFLFIPWKVESIKKQKTSGCLL